MYVPPRFKSEDRGAAARLMREYPFASLISCDGDGLPYVTHLPLLLEERAGEADGQPPRWVLLGHVAKPNAHWRHLQARPTAVAAFLGPHAYISPGVYPDLARVPSWNYLAVHCTVQARLVEDAEAKDALLKKLIGAHEPPYAQQWRDLPENYTDMMLNAIVAFELDVTAWQCKLKMNQHQPESHAALHARFASGSENERALLRWLDESKT